MPLKKQKKGASEKERKSIVLGLELVSAQFGLRLNNSRLFIIVVGRYFIHTFSRLLYSPNPTSSFYMYIWHKRRFSNFDFIRLNDDKSNEIKSKFNIEKWDFNSPFTLQYCTLLARAWGQCLQDMKLLSSSYFIPKFFFATYFLHCAKYACIYIVHKLCGFPLYNWTVLYSILCITKFEFELDCHKPGKIGWNFVFIKCNLSSHENEDN